MKPRARASLPPLSPLGTARQRLAGTAPAAAALPPEIEAVLRDADLGQEAAFLVWQLAAWASPQAPLSPADHRALLAVLARSLVAVAHGSTRVAIDAAERALLERLPELVGVAGERRPLLLDGGHLYQQKLLACEDRVVAAVRARFAAPAPFAAHEIARALAAVSESASPRPTAEQLAAAQAALGRRLTVITGGPGTGKTTIALTLVRTLVRLGVAPSAIALAAPTGRAAGRLQEAVRAGLDRLGARPPEDEALAAAAPAGETLHRLLGYSPGGGGFLHHERSPLPHRAVIVDEGSMIDLSLMDRLLRALAPDAALVLLGDADQLPSVDAGAAFRDLASAGAVTLGQSHRVDPSAPAGRAILEVAARVRAGDVSLASPYRERATAAALAFDGVELCPGSAREALLERWYAERIEAPALAALVERPLPLGDDGFAAEEVARLDAAHAHLQRVRLLCVTRGRATGVEAVNAWMHERHDPAAGSLAGALAPGEPVIMLHNDYERGLYNGDQGLVVRVREEGRPARLAIAFPARERWTAWELDSLRDSVALAFALTVHKAQGSEHEEVALLLPETPLPLLSRELLYTALTRSRRAVVICGAPAVLAAGIAQSTARASGIAEKLGAG